MYMGDYNLLQIYKATSQPVLQWVVPTGLGILYVVSL